MLDNIKPNDWHDNTCSLHEKPLCKHPLKICHILRTMTRRALIVRVLQEELEERFTAGKKTKTFTFAYEKLSLSQI